MWFLPNMNSDDQNDSYSATVYTFSSWNGFYCKISEKLRKTGVKEEHITAPGVRYANNPQIRIFSFINKLSLNLPKMKIKTLSALWETELRSNRKWPYKALQFWKVETRTGHFQNLEQPCVYRHWGWTRQHLWLRKKNKPRTPHHFPESP